MTDIRGLKYQRLLRKDLKQVRTLMLTECAGIPSTIRRPIELLIDRGGKRLRPALVLLHARMSGADHSKALLAAAGVEMLHTATLVHDDLIDDAKLRRGVETLNSRWSPTATILAGDTMFGFAAKLIAGSENATLAYHFAETLESICAGELRQMLSRDGTLPTIEMYYDRIFAKTASLFALCVESGPILAGLDEDAIADARQFGKLLGEAFQIADDVLDLVGTEERLGKPAGTDLNQGLVTLPVIAYTETHPNDPRIAGVLHDDIDEAVFESLIADIRASEAIEIAMQHAEAHIEEALGLLNKYPETPYRQATAEIAKFAVQRRF